jgi:hypothetical protein
MVQFSKIEFDEHGNMKVVPIRSIKQSDIQACPHHVYDADHYRDDGTCKCNDPSDLTMAEWGYTWRDGQWR